MAGASVSFSFGGASVMSVCGLAGFGQGVDDKPVDMSFLESPSPFPHRAQQDTVSPKKDMSP